MVARNVRWLGWIVLVCCAAFVFSALTPTAVMAQRRDNWYASITIENPFRHKIHYKFRWGEGEWKDYSIQPGWSMTHTYQDDFANQNRSPRPYTAFDMGGGIANRSYWLKANAAPDTAARWGYPY